MELDAEWPSLLWKTATLLGYISPAYVFHVWVIMFTYLGLVGAWVHYRNHADDQADIDRDYQEKGDAEDSSETFEHADENEAFDLDLEPASTDFGTHSEILCTDRETQTDRMTDGQQSSDPRATLTCEEFPSCEIAREVEDCKQSTNVKSGSVLPEDNNVCDSLLNNGLDIGSSDLSAVVNVDRDINFELKYRKVEVDKTWEIVEKEIEIGFVSELDLETPPIQDAIFGEIINDEAISENCDIREDRSAQDSIVNKDVPVIVISDDSDVDISGGASNEVKKSDYVGENFIWCAKDEHVAINSGSVPGLESGSLESPVELEKMVPVECKGSELTDSGVREFDDKLVMELEDTEQNNQVSYGDLGVKVCDESNGRQNGFATDTAVFKDILIESESVVSGYLVDLRSMNMEKFDEPVDSITVENKGDFDLVVEKGISDFNRGSVNLVSEKIEVEKHGISELVNSIDACEENEIFACEKVDESAPAAIEKQTNFESNNGICKHPTCITEQTCRPNAREVAKWIGIQGEISDNESEASCYKMYLDDDISVGYSETRGDFKEIADDVNEISECCSFSTDVNSEFPDGYSDVCEEKLDLNFCSREEYRNMRALVLGNKATEKENKVIEVSSDSEDTSSEARDGFSESVCVNSNMDYIDCNVSGIWGGSKVGGKLSEDLSVKLDTRNENSVLQPSIDLASEIPCKEQDFVKEIAEDSADYDKMVQLIVDDTSVKEHDGNSSKDNKEKLFFGDEYKHVDENKQGRSDENLGKFPQDNLISPGNESEGIGSVEEEKECRTACEEVDMFAIDDKITGQDHHGKFEKEFEGVDKIFPQGPFEKIGFDEFSSTESGNNNSEEAYGCEISDDKQQNDDNKNDMQELFEESVNVSICEEMPENFSFEAMVSAGEYAEVQGENEDCEAFDENETETEEYRLNRCDLADVNLSKFSEGKTFETSESSDSYEDVPYEPLVSNDNEEWIVASPIQPKFEKHAASDVILEANRESKETKEGPGLKVGVEILETVEEVEEICCDEQVSYECLAVALPNAANRNDANAISTITAVNCDGDLVSVTKLNWREISLAFSGFPEGLSFLTYFRKSLLNPAGFVDVFNNNPLEFHCFHDNVSKYAQIYAERLKLRADFQSAVIHESLCAAKKNSKLLEEIVFSSSKSTKGCKCGEGLIKLPGCFGNCYPEKADFVVKQVVSSSACKPQIIVDGVEIVNNGNKNKNLSESTLPAISTESLKEFHSQHNIKTKPKYAWESTRGFDDFVFLTSLAAVDAEDFSGSSTSLESTEECLEGEIGRLDSTSSSLSNLRSSASLTDEEHRWKKLKRNSEGDLQFGATPKRGRSFKKCLLPVSKPCFDVPFERKYEFFENEFFQRLLNSQGLSQTNLKEKSEFFKNNIDSEFTIPGNLQTNLERNQTNPVDLRDNSFETFSQVPEDFNGEGIKTDMGQGQSVGLTKGTLAMPVSNYLLKGISVRNHGEYTVINYKNTRFSPIITVDRKIEITLNVPKSKNNSPSAKEGSIVLRDPEQSNDTKKTYHKRLSDVVDGKLLDEFINKQDGNTETDSKVPKLSTLIKDQFEFYVKSNCIECVSDHVMADSLSTKDVADINGGVYPKPVSNDELKVETRVNDVVLEPVAVQIIDAEQESCPNVVTWDEKEDSTNFEVNPGKMDATVEEQNKPVGNIDLEVSEESRHGLNEGDCNSLIQSVKSKNLISGVNTDICLGCDKYEGSNRKDQNIYSDCEQSTLLGNQSDSSPEICINVYDTGDEVFENNEVLIEDVDTKLLLAETKPEESVAVKLRSRSLSSLPEGHSEPMAWFYRNRPSSVCLEEGPSTYSDYGTLRRAKSAEISRKKPKIVIATNLERKSIKETNLDELMKSLEFLGPRSISDNNNYTSDINEKSSRADIVQKETVENHVGKKRAWATNGNVSDIRKAKSTTILASRSNHDDKNGSVATLIEKFESRPKETRKLVIETKTIHTQSSRVRNAKSMDIAENLRNLQNQNKAVGLIDDNNNKRRIEDRETIVRSSKSIVRPTSLAVDEIETRSSTTNAAENATKDLVLRQNEKTKRDLNTSNNVEVGKTIELGIINTTEDSERNNPVISDVWKDSAIDSQLKQNAIPGDVRKTDGKIEPTLGFYRNGVVEGAQKSIPQQAERVIEALCEPELSISQEQEVKRTSIYGLTVVLSESHDQAELEVESKNEINKAREKSEEHFWLEQCNGNEAKGKSSTKVSDIDLLLKTPFQGSCESLDSLLHDGGNACCAFCGKKLKEKSPVGECYNCADKLQRQKSQEQAENRQSRSRNSFRKDRRLRKWLEERQNSLQSEDRVSIDDMDAEDQSRLLQKIARSKGIAMENNEEHDIRNKRYSSLQSRHVDFLTQLRYLINFEDDDYDDYVKDLVVTEKEQDAIVILKEYEMSRQLKKGKSPFTSDDEGNDSDAFTDITDTSLSDYTRSRYSLNSLSLSRGSLHKTKSIDVEEEHQQDLYHNVVQEDAERHEESIESSNKIDIISRRQEDYESLLKAVTREEVTIQRAQQRVVEEEHKVEENFNVSSEEKVVNSVEEQIASEFFSPEDVNGLISMANSAVRNRRNRAQRNSVPKSVLKSESLEEKPRAQSLGSMDNNSRVEVFLQNSEQSLGIKQNGWETHGTENRLWPIALNVYEDSPWSLSMERLKDASYGNLRAKLDVARTAKRTPTTSTPHRSQAKETVTYSSEDVTDFTSLPSPVIRELKISPKQKRRAASLRDLTPKHTNNAPSVQKFQSVPTSPPRYVRESPFRKSTGSYDQKKKAHRSLPDLIDKPTDGPSSPVRLSKFPSGGSSTFSLSKRSPRTPHSPVSFRSPRSGSHQSPRSSFRSPVRSPLRSPRISEIDDDVADCETVYSDFTACFSDSSMDVGMALDGYELEDEDFFLPNSSRPGNFSPSFDDFLLHENDDASSGEYFVPLHTESKRPQGRLIACAFGPCKNTDYAEWAQRSQFTSCVSCFTYYCSKECRKADWKVHKLTCYYGRINYYTKALVRRFETNSEINNKLSLVAVGGFQVYGRGCVHITFTSPMAAKFFLVSGTNAFVKDPVYAPLGDVTREGIITKHKVLLQQTLVDYDPEHEFVVNLTVFVGKQNQAVVSPRSRFKTSALLRCSKIPLGGSYSAGVNEPSLDASYQIKVFYLPRSRNHHFVNETEARRYYCREVSYGLRKYGIYLKHEFPDVYDKLCLYVEHNVEFVPITLYGQASGKNYKCVIFPEGFSTSGAESMELQGRGMLV